MKQTLLDQLFYNQDKWRECERKIAKYDAARSTIGYTNFVIIIAEWYVPAEHKFVLSTIACYFLVVIAFLIYFIVKSRKLRKERETYARNYYEYMDLLIKSKIVEVHDEQES